MTDKRSPNEGGMEQPHGCVITDERGLFRVNIPRTLFQRKLEFIHGVQLIHVSDDIFHFAFAMNFPRDVFERCHDFRIHPLVHIFDDFVVMIVMRVHV